MIRYVCSVFDSASQLYGSPFFVASVAQAMRSVTDEVNRAASDNPLFMHPDDFDLYQLGTFDDEEGQFVNARRLLLRGKDAQESRKE